VFELCEKRGDSIVTVHYRNSSVDYGHTHCTNFHQCANEATGVSSNEFDHTGFVCRHSLPVVASVTHNIVISTRTMRCLALQYVWTTWQQQFLCGSTVYIISIDIRFVNVLLCVCVCVLLTSSLHFMHLSKEVTSMLRNCCWKTKRTSIPQTEHQYDVHESHALCD